jgi:putative ABC transport system permease protein
MKFLPLIWAGLWRKPFRTVMTIAAIAVAFVLFGLVGAIDQEIAATLRRASTQNINVESRFGSVRLPYAYREQIAAIPGVVAVSGSQTMSGHLGDPKDRMTVVVADQHFFEVNDELLVTPQQIKEMHRTPSGLFVGSALAAQHGWKVRDRIVLQTMIPQQNGSRDWSFDILGLVENPNAEWIAKTAFANYEYMDAAQAVNRGTILRFTARAADPAQSMALSQSIDAAFANAEVSTRSASAYANYQNYTHSMGDLAFFVDAIIAVVFLMLLVLTSTTMSEAARERTADFGILKTVGMSDTGVFVIMLAEGAIQAICGAALGLALAGPLIVLLPRTMVPVPSTVPGLVVTGGMIAALAVAAFSAGPAAVRVARMPATVALASRTSA